VREEGKGRRLKRSPLLRLLLLLLLLLPPPLLKRRKRRRTKRRWFTKMIPLVVIVSRVLYPLLFIAVNLAQVVMLVVVPVKFVVRRLKWMIKRQEEKVSGKRRNGDSGSNSGPMRLVITSSFASNHFLHRCCSYCHCYYYCYFSSSSSSRRLSPGDQFYVVSRDGSRCRTATLIRRHHARNGSGHRLFKVSYRDGLVEEHVDPDRMRLLSGEEKEEKE